MKLHAKMGKLRCINPMISPSDVQAVTSKSEAKSRAQIKE